MNARSRSLLIGAILIGGTLLLYARAATFDFINLDDPEYVWANPRVLGGLTASSVRWAFNIGYAGNWHPLTWISHMLDVELFGNKPGPMHAINVVIHIANTLLLWRLLLRLTGAVWPPAWIAAMFAWHPLHVESVAWISERKDLLSTFFMLLCILAYLRYVHSRSRGAYLAAIVMLALGLMCKPMLVTLPFLLLLLDVWPLQRSHLRRLLIEKLPMFALVVASSIVTFIAQSRGGSVASLDRLSITSRLANAILAYATYLWQLICPTKLAVMYPLERGAQSAHFALAATVLLAISALAIVRWRRWPWLAMGWCWYLGTLVPVIGLVQVGVQSHADRYTYVPSIGIFIAVAFSAAAFALRSETARRIVIAAAITSTLSASAFTWRQIGHWRDAGTLMAHTLRIVPENPIALAALGDSLLQRGETADAIARYRQALRLSPNSVNVLNNLAWLRATHPQPRYQDGPEAERLAQRAADLTGSAQPNVLDTLAAAHARQGRFEQAIPTAEKAAVLAEQQNHPELAAQIRARVALYRSGRPYDGP